MGNWTDFIALFDVIDRVEGVVSSFIHADWKGASSKGPAGITSELGRTLTGANRWRIWVDRRAGWSGVEIERFLRKYGVVIWDRGFVGDSYFFCVKERQANWAEYLLLRRGIPITGSIYNQDNQLYGGQHAPGDAPPAWADGARPRPELPRSFVDRLSDWL
jgi:hypothetical protein